ncbi:SecDF P1 head subdomain-containing protein [Brucella cytisi]|uniref:SecDF P1 head subdomain domain-containing protein n=1 Tax=Brucella cytisi TaxID=407152 RepID=A0A1J6I5T4_9HYPH|nr:hypothetical protein [Brucella cytisi]OIS94266.1 hypothetical protein BLA27_07085 [Brucella cytisi]
MVLKKRALVICVATMLVSPALAETLNLKVESGAITGITDRQTGQLVLYITEKSSRDLADFTERHVGKKIDILVGEKLVGSPTIRSPIYGPQIPIALPMTDMERREIIAKLIEGAATLQLPTSDD